MGYLILAVAASALVSVIMRLSSQRVAHNIAMLTMNYLMCTVVSAAYVGFTALLPRADGLPAALSMGAIHGALYLISFVLLQSNIKKNGVVLSATFMKLGLLVPMAASVLFFGEMPSVAQLLGFAMAIAAIFLINREKDSGAARSVGGLLLLLLCGGCGDVMAKVFEQFGEAALSGQFLFYTFTAALTLCFLLMLYHKQHPGKAEIFWGILIGVPNFFSAKFLLRALDTVPAVIAYPTYSVATLLVITLAGVLLFRERLDRRQWLALGIILAALALLNL